MASHAVPVLRAASGLVALAAIAASSGAAPPARRSAVAGDLDFTFGRSGQVTTDISDDDEAFAIVAQPDGKLVAAGRAGGQFALVRYDRDGTLDPIFGQSGRVMTSFPGDAGASALVLQPDGKLVAAGRAGGEFALARYGPDGILDPVFGRSGRVTTAFGTDAEALALVLQPDGKLVAAGRAGTDLALVRYEPDGTLDPFFGRSGRVRTAFSGNASALAVALDTDGKLVVAGRDGGRFAVARYDADGLLDVFFGTGGEVTTAFAGDDVAFAVALDCDGSLVAAGRAAGDGGSRFALARYDRRGVLDPFFGTGGQATATFSGRDEARALLLQPDGKPVAAGRASPDGVGGDVALARYEGSPDCADLASSVPAAPPGSGRVARGPTPGVPRAASDGDLSASICRGEVPRGTVERRLRLANAWLARAEKTSSQRRARGSVRRAERVLARAGAAVERAGRDGTLSPPCAAAFRRLLDARLSQTRPEARR